MKSTSSAGEIIRRSPVLGFPIAVTDYQEAVTQILHWVAERDRPYLVAAANTHVVTLTKLNTSFAHLLAKFDLVVPDGMPLVWYLNHFRKGELSDRVYGPELMLRCFAASQNGEKHFLLGGSDEMREKLEKALLGRFPGLALAGGYSPPFGSWDANEYDKICQLIEQSGAHLVWLGLGCPKQEEFLARLKPHLAPAVYLAVGAAFPLISGTVRQAPTPLQKAGLEWAFRLLMEPRRLWKRYLLHNSLFLYYVAKERVHGS
jgi:N-acetylglucosaminyldiphosphoundecaprenol N-acetyl-beta-D-mannosaminyltransferase